MEYFVDISPGIITALLGSYLAAKWAMRKLYSEKWWDRKEQAYAEIIDALYDVIQYCEIQKDDYGQGTGHSKDRENELAKNYTIYILYIYIYIYIIGDRPQFLQFLRNSLVHELREPGHGNEFSGKREDPYYHGRTEFEGLSMIGRQSLELVYPLAFYFRITTTIVENVQKYLHTNDINPYECYQFGSSWLGEFN